MTATRTIALLLALPVLAGLMSGCTRNPATGSPVFTGGLTAAEERQIGRENHPKIVEEFSGEYSFQDLQAYVEGLGQKLARISDRKEINFRFTLLNSDIINAFAVPGGYIYVTRGLVTLADNEAQLAGVLAHEIGHVAALHHARRYGSSLVAGIGVLAAGILGGEMAARASQLGAVTALQSFSREHEHEADDLGVRYLARAGYDPGAMAGFLRKLRAHSRLEKQRRGEDPDSIDQFNYLATHPAPAARVVRAEGLAAKENVRNPRIGRDEYLTKIDGVLFGDDPAQGFLHGRNFLHPQLRFAFEVPKDFSVFNTKSEVLAFGPDRSRVIFDHAEKPYSGSIRSYMENVWGRGKSLRDIRTRTVNDMEAATASATARTNEGTFDAKLVAYRFDDKAIYRFLFLAPRNRTTTLAADFEATTASFRKLGAAEADKLKPLVVNIETVRRGDTVSRLANQMPFDDFRIERFRVLNGLSEKDGLKAGDRIKTVTFGR